MFRPTWNLDLPMTSDGAHFAPIQIALKGLCEVNQWYITRALRDAQKGLGVPFPPLYASGVKYEADPPGKEEWRDCRAVLRNGKGDCDNLVAWRVGELWAAGVPVEPVLKWQLVPRDLMIEIGYPKKHVPREGIWLTHCLVRWPDGSVEDPSKILGMKGNFLDKV